MTKDEMKNRISMALKDPTLQQGFEIICKENAELKKRNGELAGQKASLERWFGEAKEIIKEYLRINLQAPIDRKFDDEVSLFIQAEQFLKESDE